jgi:hypothetical protein
LARSHAVEELFENWQLAHHAAMLAGDVEELLAEWLDLCKLLKCTWETLYDALFEAKIFDFEMGEMLRLVFGKTTEIGKKLGEWLAGAEQDGYRIENAATFRTALTSLEQLIEEIESKWPTIDHEMAAESLAAYHRGEYQTIEELLDEAQGHHSGSD